MKSYLLFSVTAALVMACHSALAGNLTVTTVHGTPFATQNGQTLKTGFAVRVGTFNLPDATRDDTLRSTSDLTKLKSWFKPLAEGVSGGGSTAQANASGSMLQVNSFPTLGDVFGTIANISDAYLVPGSKLYLWVFDNADPDKAEQWGIFTANDWLAPQALGVQALSTSSDMTILQGSATSGQLRLAVPKPCYGNWALKHFSAVLPKDATAATADPDGDGICNLAEYAWQLNPQSKDSSRATLSADNSRFTFQSPRNLTDVRVVAEYSVDLKTWTQVPGSVVSSDADFDTRQCIPPPGARQCFWRVRVTALSAQ